MVILGCGSPAISPDLSSANGTVKGTITHQARPVSNATVVLYSMESHVGRHGTLNSKGEFELNEAIPTGTYVVYLHRNGQPLSELPEKYAVETKSDKTVQVVSGENDLKIDLEK